MGRIPATTSAEVRHHYDVEVELAERLRSASKEERLAGLYISIYAERLERIQDHPLLLRSLDEVARERATIPQLRLLETYLSPDVVFMEIGPGDCALALAVAERVSEVYAVDVTDALLHDPRRPDNFRFVSTNGVEIAVPPGKVDLAFSYQVLEHLHPEDAQDHLQEVHTALRPGGRFICITPNRLSGPWDISRRFDSAAKGLHLKEYTLSEQADLLRACGFEVSFFGSLLGHHFLRRMPEAPIRVLERALARGPRRVARYAAMGLATVKIVATKPG